MIPSMTSDPDQYYKILFPFYESSFIDASNAVAQVLSTSTQFNMKLYDAFTTVYHIYINTISEYNKSWKDLSELDKVLRSKFLNALDEKFREEDFVRSLSETVATSSQLAKITGSGKIYKYLSNMLSVWNNDFIDPIRNTVFRTPSEKVCEIEKYSLFRYKSFANITDEKASGSIDQNNTPLLVIYAFINRDYILDLLPEISVIRSLLNQGLDIFATDWGTPSIYDKSLTISHFISRYLDKSVDYIRNVTNSDKVSLLGYCWGGSLALMYAALHPEKVKNLVTIATPGDFDLDDSLLSTWTKAMKSNYLLDAFGNLPGIVLNAAFILRNPIEYGHKYFHFFEQPRSLEAVAQFFAIETWLYDSPPIIGEIYRQFVEDCYKRNLLIKNKMRIGGVYNDNGNSGTVINLKKINMPFLNILAKKDDLVAPNSSKALNDVLTESHDKDLIEHDSGHVGLMIGKRAQKELWPKAGAWLKSRS